MRITHLIAAAGFSLLACITTAFADNCSDLVVDELGAISDKRKVTEAARAFANQGFEVRVRAFKSRRGAKNIDEFEQAYRKECPQWTIGSRLRSPVLLFLYVDNRSSDPWVGVYYGDGLSKLDSQYRKILAAEFIPLIRSFRAGDASALTPGFVNALNEFREVATRSGNATSTSTTIVRTQPTDLSGLWWVMGIAVVGGIVVVGAIMFLRSRSDTDDKTSAQAEAQRSRSGCIDRLLKLTDETEQTVRQAKVDDIRPRLSPAKAKSLDADLQKVNDLGKRGLAALTRFDSPEKDDPNRRGLSIDAYRSNQMRYEEIIVEFIEPAEEIIGKINEAATVAAAA